LSVALNNGAANFTIDGGHTNLDPSTPGINMGASTFFGTPGPQHITIKNVAITGASSGGVFEFSGPTNTGIVLDHDVWHDVMDTGTEANIRFSYDGPSGVTIQNSLFENSVADGVKVGASGTAIMNTEFLNIYPFGHSELHTDAIQLCCGYSSGSNSGSGGLTIVGNFIHGHCEQGLGAFDGTGNNVVQHNVIVGCTAHSLVLGGDKPGSTVEWNTVVGASNAVINCTSKSGEGPSTTAISNNFASGGLDLSSSVPCSPSLDTHNMCGFGCSSPNFNGTPVFVGGASPTTYAGYALASTSPGYHSATDGGQVGAFGGGWTGGPPAH
jgi:hypothetical protein